jgi:hypothetical protein
MTKKEPTVDDKKAAKWIAEKMPYLDKKIIQDVIGHYHNYMNKQGITDYIEVENPTTKIFIKAAD